MSKTELKVKEDQGLTGYSTARLVQQGGFLGTETKFIERIGNDTQEAVEKVVNDGIVKGWIRPKK